jgi:hypothetical protein
MKIPTTAREQLLLAHELGHDLSIELDTRVVCTCGYRSTTRRSKSALNGTMAWHLSRAIADGLDRVNGS